MELQYGFQKKAVSILTQKPDILVIVECEHPDKLLFHADVPKPTDSLWFGKNHHKGLAVFSYGDFRFKIHKDHNEDFKMIIPIEVKGGHYDFNLFLVWHTTKMTLTADTLHKFGRQSFITTSY